MGLFTPDENLEHESPRSKLERLASEAALDITSVEFSRYLDNSDPLSSLREEFVFPMMDDLKCDGKGNEKCVYMCGHSLGLQPKKAMGAMLQVMDEMAIEGKLPEDFDLLDKEILPTMAKMVGASTKEITILEGLSVNLHLLMISFYRASPSRNKILIEYKAFPSDHYLTQSQIRYNGYDPETSLIAMKPREGEELLRTEDIVNLIEREGDSIAVVLLPGVQYYTGQLFDMETIANVAHKKGCMVGFDLAHAIGNVEVKLHDWGVDFAAWCTYKYLNSGPGSVGGMFIHDKHADKDLVKFLGRESHGGSVSDCMINDYVIRPPCPLLLSNIRCSMEIFGKTSVKELRNKSFYLTGYLEYLLRYYFPKTDDEAPIVSTITSEKFRERGAQLSLVFSVPITKVHEEMTKRGVICDVRKPRVIRIAPIPMYTKFHDVYRFVHVLRDSFEYCKRHEEN